MFTMPALSTASESTAVTAMGTSWMFCERFCAVTTTSSSTAVRGFASQRDHRQRQGCRYRQAHMGVVSTHGHRPLYGFCDEATAFIPSKT
jgi:hypothetical protein